MALRMHPVSASRWAELAASRKPAAPRTIDLTEEPDGGVSDPGRVRRAELALIQAYIDALRPQPVSARR